MKLAEIKELTQGEIKDELKKSDLELVGLRMKFASRQLENPSLIKAKRKEIARLLTIQTQKKLEKPSPENIEIKEKHVKVKAKEIKMKTQKEKPDKKQRKEKK